MREINLSKIEQSLNKWLNDHNIPVTYSMKRLERVYEFIGTENGRKVMTKLTEINTFDAHWEDHIEQIVHSHVDISLHKALEFRNFRQ